MTPDQYGSGAAADLYRGFVQLAFPTSPQQLLLYGAMGPLFGLGEKALLSATESLGRAGLSAVGRALQSHAAREGSFFAAGRTAAENTQMGENFLRFLFKNGTAAGQSHPVFGEVVNIRLANGAGARVSANGEFLGLLEPYTPR